MSETLYADIRSALTSRLKDFPGGIDVAWGNRKYEPKVGTPYLIPAWLPSDSRAVTCGTDGLNEDTGVYQITLTNYPVDTGEGEMMEMASRLRDWFKRGTDLLYNGVLVRVRKVTASPIINNELHISVSYYLQTSN